MSTNNFKIAEFSRLCRVTVKTLRHYEKIGLLIPAHIDRWTGYRYYDVAQMQTMSTIRRLKELGFSLEEILEMTEDGNLSPGIETLEEKIAQCRLELQRLQRRHSILQSLLNSQKQLYDMEKYSIQSLPAITVASHREFLTSYADLGRVCYETIGPEMARLGCVCTEPGYCFSIEHSDYTPEGIDVEYCEQVEDDCENSPVVQFKHLPAIAKALCIKHIGPYELFPETFAEAFRYMEENKMRIGGAPRTCYVDGIWNQEDPARWISIIQIPLEQ